ncbi:uncharacterized protein LOC119745675 isoform X2 [Patiria miniata]|uniref:Uncharacterized protein n=1 Tax=Patiria miniata TaxID=46514 RepID=A0A914BPR7_PATMI|nr:uncharacterized protein LOC119745675 isoform X2 [Patiria miniata]
MATANIPREVAELAGETTRIDKGEVHTDFSVEEDGSWDWEDNRASSNDNKKPQFPPAFNAGSEVPYLGQLKVLYNDAGPHKEQGERLAEEVDAGLPVAPNEELAVRWAVIEYELEQYLAAGLVPQDSVDSAGLDSASHFDFKLCADELQSNLLEDKILEALGNLRGFRRYFSKSNDWLLSQAFKGRPIEVLQHIFYGGDGLLAASRMKLDDPFHYTNADHAGKKATVDVLREFDRASLSDNEKPQLEDKCAAEEGDARPPVAPNEDLAVRWAVIEQKLEQYLAAGLVPQDAVDSAGLDNSSHFDFKLCVDKLKTNLMEGQFLEALGNLRGFRRYFSRSSYWLLSQAFKGRPIEVLQHIFYGGDGLLAASRMKLDDPFHYTNADHAD